MKKISQQRLASRLPSPKGVALAIVQICHRENASLAELVRVLQTDPALACRVLSLANRLKPGRRVVASIEEAAERIGLKLLRQLVLSFVLAEQYKPGVCGTFDYAGYWSRALLMAIGCEEVAGVLRIGHPQELYTCGLLADIGRLAMATEHPEVYADILKQRQVGRALLDAEQARLHKDHRALTREMLDECRLPQAMCEAIALHELADPSLPPDGAATASSPRLLQLTRVLHFVSCLADQGMKESSEPPQSGVVLLSLGETIGLDAAGVEALYVATLRKWRQRNKWPMALLPTPDAEEAEPTLGDGMSGEEVALRVLLVEDDPVNRLYMKSLLDKRNDCVVYTANDGEQGLALALKVMPQIVITDWIMPKMDGVEFCRALRATDWGRSMYVIMLTGVGVDNKIVEAFEVGVDDYVTKPINQRALNARLRAAVHYAQLLETWADDRAQLNQFAADLEVSNRRLEQVAMTDMLTGLPNRRAGMDNLSRAWSAAQRSQRPLSVMMLDIDYFKRINDTYGHAAGDKVLCAVAKALDGAGRTEDRPSRVGGEEFLIVCPNTSAAAAMRLAERLRNLVGEICIDVEGTELRTSISVGVAERRTEMQHTDELVGAADKALYAAKRAGRNCVCLADANTALIDAA